MTAEAATRGVLQEKEVLETLQNSQENTCARVPPPPHLLYFMPLLFHFSKPPLLAGLFWKVKYPSEISAEDKCKNKLIRQSYIFIFKRLKNSVTYMAFL